MPFQVTAQGSLFPTEDPSVFYWLEQQEWIIGNLSRHATVVYDTSAMTDKRVTRNIYLGFETGVVTFDEGGTLELLSHFAAPHQASPTVSMINESGVIANGSGPFANVSGHFTSHGFYGPGVPALDPGGLLGVLATFQGNICGVDIGR